MKRPKSTNFSGKDFYSLVKQSDFGEIFYDEKMRVEKFLARLELAVPPVSFVGGFDMTQKNPMIFFVDKEHYLSLYLKKAEALDANRLLQEYLKADKDLSKRWVQNFKIDGKNFSRGDIEWAFEKNILEKIAGKDQLSFPNLLSAYQRAYANYYKREFLKGEEV